METNKMESASYCSIGAVTQVSKRSNLLNRTIGYSSLVSFLLSLTFSSVQALSLSLSPTFPPVHGNRDHAVVVWERISLLRHLCQIGENINLFIPSKAIKSNGIYNIPIISVNSHKQTSTLHPHAHIHHHERTRKKQEQHEFTKTQNFRPGEVWRNKIKKKIYLMWKKSHRKHTRETAISPFVWLFAFFNEIIFSISDVYF